MSLKIIHLTSVHPRYDTRIFVKMCSSLSKVRGYKVSLVVADGKGDEIKDEIRIFDVGKLTGRLNRIFKTTKKIFKKAVELDGDVYHIHDPELIHIGLKLKKLGKKVIFDIHENIALQIIDKEYIPYFFRHILSFFYRMYEKITLNKFDSIILAENSYKKYYKKLNSNFEVILNLPDIKPLERFVNFERSKNEIFYIGGVSNNRGLEVTIESLRILKKIIPDIFIHYVGNYEKTIITKIDFKGIENNIKFYGHMQLLDGLIYSVNAKVGISILKPIKNYTNSYSTKVFEYMAIGLPVVTSNFELYKNIIEKYNCGICVNPLDPREIADAIKKIIENPKEAKQMGKNGRKIILEKYNWSLEERKLYRVYKDL